MFTEMTPPPNTAGGGLANALAGSGLLILWATIFGTPLGIMPFPFNKFNVYVLQFYETQSLPYKQNQ